MCCMYCSVLMQNEEYIRLQGCCDACVVRYAINRETDIRALQCVICRRAATRIQESVFSPGDRRIVCNECAEHTHDPESLCPSCGRVCRTCPRGLILCLTCRMCQLCTLFHERELNCCECDTEYHFDCRDCGRPVQYESPYEDGAGELCNPCYEALAEREYREEEHRQARERARAIRAQVKHHCTKCKNTISLCFCPVAV